MATIDKTTLGRPRAVSLRAEQTQQCEVCSAELGGARLDLCEICSTLGIRFATRWFNDLIIGGAERDGAQDVVFSISERTA